MSESIGKMSENVGKGRGDQWGWGEGGHQGQQYLFVRMSVLVINVTTD